MWPGDTVYWAKVSDDPHRTYTAREIILSLFPATPEPLIPAPERVYVEPSAEGTLLLWDSQGWQGALLTPVARAGNPLTQVCCEACERSGPRYTMQTFRAEVPGSQGRRFRYVTLCREAEQCEARRIGDRALQELLERVLRP